LKIAQVCPRYFPYIGGIETNVKEISERLVLENHEVEVITTDPIGKLKKKDIINGVKVTRFKSFAPGEAYYFAPQICIYLMDHSYDVIHAHSYHALPAFFAALSKRNKRFIFSPHYHRGGHTPLRDLLHKPYKIFGEMIFSRADAIICVSEYEKELVESDFNVKEKTIKIPNGLNLSEFGNMKRQKSEDKKKILLYVGRLEEYKGVQYVIQSLSELPDFRLKIVGKGPYEDKLHSIAERIGVAERIEWLKDISRRDLLECYADADIFLMLSLHEAYGITVAEALASGTLCVVVKGSALEEFVDGINCIGIEKPPTKEKVIKVVQGMEKVKKQTNSGIKKGLLDWNEVVDKIGKLYVKK